MQIKASPSINKYTLKQCIQGLIALFLTLACWALSSPVGSSPDDDYHLPSIWCANGTDGENCQQSGDIFTTPGGVANSATCYAFDPYKTADCATLALNGPSVSQVYINQNTNWYPPFFYKFSNLFLVDSGVIESILSIRFANIFLFCLFFLWYFLLAKTPREHITSLLIPISIFIPLGFFIIPSTNPSSWAITFGLMSFLALSSWIFFRNQTRGMLVYMLTVSLFFVGSRADSGGYLIAMIICLGMSSKILIRRNLKEDIKLIPIVLMVLIGVLSLVSYQAVAVIQSGLRNEEVLNPPPRNGFYLLGVNLIRFPELVVGNFGTRGLGWLDTVPPLIVPIIVIISLTYLVATAINVRADKGFVSSIFFLIIIPIYVLQKGNNVVGEHVQPRYLIPLIILVFGIMIINSDRVQLSSSALLGLTLLFTTAHSISLYTNISRYSVGIGQDFLLSEVKWGFPGISPRLLFVAGTLFGWIFFKNWTSILGFYTDSSKVSRSKNGESGNI